MSDKGGKFREDVSRRTWLQASIAAGVGALILPDVAFAETPRVEDALRVMSPTLTGAQLPQSWVQPVSGLVSVILDGSKGLRALDLQDVEPATTFTAE